MPKWVTKMQKGYWKLTLGFNDKKMLADRQMGNQKNTATQYFNSIKAFCNL